jgi:CRISPR-associated protein Cmr6
MLPLYAQIPGDSFEKASTAHSGLLFDKFPDGWNPDENYQLKKSKKDKNKEDDIKNEFLRRIINKYEVSRPTLTANLKIALERQHDLLEHLKETRRLTVSTDWRFVSGLGAAHPYETGFIWHRTLSVPYLPGSSIKGLMRAWAEQWGEPSDQEAATYLFGTENEEAHCGALIVFDALPNHPPKLEIDILNPHYSEYYKDPANNPPADYLSPKPVFFLTVAPEQDFEFFLATRPGTSKQPQQDLETGLGLLLEALKTLGAGGKTAVGYGAFKESKAERQKREAEQEKKLKQREDDAKNAALNAIVVAKAYTGLVEQIYRQAQQENWEASDNTPKFYQAIPDYLHKISEEADSKIQQDAIDIIWELVEKKFPGIMQDPDKKVGRNKDKSAYKDKPKEIAKKLLALNNR